LDYCNGPFSSGGQTSESVEGPSEDRALPLHLPHEETRKDSERAVKITAMLLPMTAAAFLPAALREGLGDIDIYRLDQVLRSRIHAPNATQPPATARRVIIRDN
jgi:hypothetical protein